MGIQEMPNEISVQILRDLPLNSLTKVSLSSRWLHEIVEPILYTSLVQRGRTAIPLLIRTILDKPHLGRHFKSIDLLDVRRSNSERQLSEDVLSLDHHAMIRTQIFEYVSAGYFRDFYGPRGGEDLYDQVTQEWCMNIFERRLNFETTAAFLLLLLPNLEQFSLEKYEICHETILSVLLAARKMQRSGKSIDDLGSLSKLRVLSLDASADYGHLLPAKTLVRISEISSLQKLSCYGIGESDAITFKHEPTTRHLSLLNSQVRLFELECILPSFNHLRSFTIEFSDLWGSPLYGDNVFTTVIRCIVQSQNTLEQLKITDNNHRGRVTKEKFPSLALFSKLRVMDIEGDFLNHPAFTFASLPLALVNLILRNSNKEDILCHLMVSLNTLVMVPNLVSVDVYIRRIVRDWKNGEEANHLSDRFRNHGVTLRVGPVGSF